MKVFCPNCGSENEGGVGGQLVCRACTTSFEVPDTSATVAERVVPLSPGFSNAPPLATMSQAPTNVLAIVSLLFALVCCSPVALITGLMALQQINRADGQQKGKEIAIIAIVLAALMLFAQVLFAVAAALNN